MKWPLNVILHHSFCNQLHAGKGLHIAIITLDFSKVSEEVATKNAEHRRCRQPYRRLTPPPRGTPANIRIYQVPYNSTVETIYTFCR